MLTLRFCLLAALLFSLVRIVIVRSAHVGPLEWVVACVLAAALVVAMLRAPRRST